MAGLQFEQLPMSPEQTMQKDVQAGKQRIQDKFSLQWQTVNNNARFLGREKHQAMLRQIDANARQEMLEFNQKAEQHMAQLNRVKQVSEAGGITPEKAKEIQTRQAYGDDVADAMYPKETSIMVEFGRLDEFSRDLDRQLGQFRVSRPGTKPPSKLAFVTPLTGAIATYRGIKRAKKRPTIQILDPSIPAKDAKGRPIKDKFDEPVMGNWREAKPEEIERYKLLSNARRGVGMKQSELLSGRDVKQRTVQPGTKGGTFGDKIAKSYKRPTITQQPRQSDNADPLGLF